MVVVLGLYVVVVLGLYVVVVLGLSVVVVLGLYVVVVPLILKRIWNPIDFQGQRSPG